MTYSDSELRRFARHLFGASDDDSPAGLDEPAPPIANHVPREGATPSPAPADPNRAFAADLFNDTGLYQPEPPAPWEPSVRDVY
jgi:hypothetical protein